MNCSSKRPLIVALAANTIEPDQKRAVEFHLRTCAECRAYLEEISIVTEHLRAVKIRSDVQASESFHRKLAARLRAERSEPFWISASSYFRALLMFNPGASIATGIILVGALGLFLFRPTSTSESDTSRIAVYEERDLRQEIAPSISNYQMVANRSFEMLDELLTVQGNKTAPATQIYTASTLSLAKDLEL